MRANELVALVTESWSGLWNYFTAGDIQHSPVKDAFKLRHSPGQRFQLAGSSRSGRIGNAVLSDLAAPPFAREGFRSRRSTVARTWSYVF